jgi:hypothetical protein
MNLRIVFLSRACRPLACSRGWSAIIAMFVCVAAHPAHADDAVWRGQSPIDANSDIRSGGVLAESHAYHRGLAPGASIAPSTPWYGYGFPVRTHRWGWFGAAHYYPTVTWHQGYYGDCVRWAHRRGY